MSFPVKQPQKCPRNLPIRVKRLLDHYLFIQDTIRSIWANGGVSSKLAEFEHHEIDETYKAFDEILKTTKFEEKTVEFRFSQLAEKYVPKGWSGSGILGNNIIRILQPIFRVSRSGSSGSTVLALNTFVIRNDTSLDEAGFNGNTFFNQKHIAHNSFKMTI